MAAGVFGYWFGWGGGVFGVALCGGVFWRDGFQGEAEFVDLDLQSGQGERIAADAGVGGHGSKLMAAPVVSRCRQACSTRTVGSSVAGCPFGS